MSLEEITTHSFLSCAIPESLFNPTRIKTSGSVQTSQAQLPLIFQFSFPVLKCRFLQKEGKTTTEKSPRNRPNASIYLGRKILLLPTETYIWALSYLHHNRRNEAK
jgi:hypothetical protein